MPSGSEMNATAVLALPLQEVSAKLRTGNTEVHALCHMRCRTESPGRSFDCMCCSLSSANDSNLGQETTACSSSCKELRV